MSESTINQRLKILIETLGLKVGAFSRALGVSETSTRNYTDRSSKPGADYLEKIAIHFNQVNLTWLITGEGEPLLTGGDSQASHIKNNYGNSVGSNNKGGSVTQHHTGATSPGERDTKLALAEKEIQHLREQLAAKDALLASKDETIAVLKSAFNRPN
jgi:hypothetical protein